MMSIENLTPRDKVINFLDQSRSSSIIKDSKTILNSSQAHFKVRSFLNSLPIDNSGLSQIDDGKEILKKRTEREIISSLIEKYGYAGTIIVGFAQRNNPENIDQLELNFPHIGKNKFSQNKLADLINTNGLVSVYKYEQAKTEKENSILYKENKLQKIPTRVGEIRNNFQLFLMKKLTKKNQNPEEMVFGIFKDLFELESLYSETEFCFDTIKNLSRIFISKYNKASKNGKYTLINSFFAEIDRNLIN